MLSKIDLLESIIDGVVLSVDDIKEAIINEFQAVDLISLLGGKSKKHKLFRKIDTCKKILIFNYERMEQK